MIAKYGNYTHVANECAVSSENIPVFNANRVFQSNTRRITISGQIFANTPALLTTTAQPFIDAYKLQGQDFKLYLDDGTTLALESYSLLSAGSLGGVRVVQAPSFPFEEAAYTTFLPYTIVLEADYPNIGSEAAVIEWQESVTISGGPPRWVLRETLNGPPIRQQTHQRTKVTAVQAGTGIGFLTWPTPPFPLWPNDLHEDRVQITRINPRTIGAGIGQSYVEWPIFWSYEFESINSLSGNPSLRPT